MKRRVLGGALLVLLVAAGCAYVFSVPLVNALFAWRQTSIPSGATRVLAGGDRMTLYALRAEGGSSDGPTFRGYPVLKTVEVGDASERAEIAAAIRAATGEGDGDAVCFLPRHGLRVARGTETVEYLICFECERLEIYLGDEKGQAGVGTAPHALLDAALAR